jgi:hypothetical protein
MTETGAKSSVIAPHHRRLLALCDQLEAVADALPQPDPQACLTLARALGPMLATAQRLEEAGLFAELRRSAGVRPALAATLDWLRLEHQVDLCYAEEVQDTLRAYGEGRHEPLPEAAGFMLRGFFEGLRRHINYEAHLAATLGEAARSSAQGMQPIEVGNLDVAGVDDADDTGLAQPRQLP